MKHSPISRHPADGISVAADSRPRGFSLVEILIVVGIIGLLTGLVAAALPGIQTRIKRGQCETVVTELSLSVDRYQLDNGIYPQHPVTAPPEDGAHVLYQALSGDQDLDGLPDDDVKVYNPNLSMQKSLSNTAQRVGKTADGTMVVLDAFGSLIRYHADPPNQKPIRTHNPTYDLWSLGGAVPGRDDMKNVSKWITNWD